MQSNTCTVYPPSEPPTLRKVDSAHGIFPCPLQTWRALVPSKGYVESEVIVVTPSLYTFGPQSFASRRYTLCNDLSDGRQVSAAAQASEENSEGFRKEIQRRDKELTELAEKSAVRSCVRKKRLITLFLLRSFSSSALHCLVLLLLLLLLLRLPLSRFPSLQPSSFLLLGLTLDGGCRISGWKLLL